MILSGTRILAGQGYRKRHGADRDRGSNDISSIRHDDGVAHADSGDDDLPGSRIDDSVDYRTTGSIDHGMINRARSPDADIGIGECTRGSRFHLAGCPPSGHDILEFLYEILNSDI